MKARDADAMNKILRYCGDIYDLNILFEGSRQALDAKMPYRHAISMCILQIGELVGHLTDEFRACHNDIPWKEIRGMRDWAAHGYESFNLDTLWSAISEDIPKLRVYCAKVLEDIQQEGTI